MGERLRGGSGKNVQRSAESKQQVRWEEKPLRCGVAATQCVWRSCANLGWGRGLSQVAKGSEAI